VELLYLVDDLEFFTGQFQVRQMQKSRFEWFYGFILVQTEICTQKSYNTTQIQKSLIKQPAIMYINPPHHQNLHTVPPSSPQGPGRSYSPLRGARSPTIEELMPPSRPRGLQSSTAVGTVSFLTAIVAILQVDVPLRIPRWGPATPVLGIREHLHQSSVMQPTFSVRTNRSC
jgi:hypothetical protein